MLVDEVEEFVLKIGVTTVGTRPPTAGVPPSKQASILGLELSKAFDADMAA